MNGPYDGLIWTPEDDAEDEFECTKCCPDPVKKPHLCRICKDVEYEEKQEKDRLVVERHLKEKKKMDQQVIINHIAKEGRILAPVPPLDDYESVHFNSFGINKQGITTKITVRWCNWDRDFYWDDSTKAFVDSPGSSQQKCLIFPDLP